MARKSSSSAVQEELYPLPDDSGHAPSGSMGAPRGYGRVESEPFDDSRVVDMESEEESPFLRGQKRVPVRRGALPKKAANRVLLILSAAVALAIVAAAAAALYDYGKHSWRFRVDSSDQIEVAGAESVSHAQIMEVMGGDIGRNIFFVPLALRKRQLEQFPWVESASVMRFVPNRLRIEIHERTPVAFARIGSHISLVDSSGMLMEIGAAKRKYSFAVVTGMNPGEPLSTRAARMKTYDALVEDLDSAGAHYSQSLSEVDLGDPDDVKVLASDANGAVLVHLGSGNFLRRYKIYVTHVRQWRQQFDKLESVDLRYDGQIIVNPDLQGTTRLQALNPAAAKAAMAAGVRTAAEVNHERYVERPPAQNPPTKDTKSKGKSGPRVRQRLTELKPVAKKIPNAAKPPSKPASPRNSADKSLPAKASPNPQPGKQAALKKPLPTTSTTTKSISKRSPALAQSASSSEAGQKKPSAGIPKEMPQQQ